MATPDDILAAHTPDVIELAGDLRRLLRDLVPKFVERSYPGWHGIGFHHPTAGYVCAVFPGADHAKVGFEHGHLLPDPNGVFDSGGERVRYISLDELTPELTIRLGELVDHAVHLHER